MQSRPRPEPRGDDALEIGAGDALVVVDVQNDFMSGGALAVPDANAILGPLNHALARFARQHVPIFASRDWHPPEHCSFEKQGGPWPPHCVAGTPGARFAPGLELPGDVRIVSKGTSPLRDAYSAFEGTDLLRQLRQLGCARLFLAGLATEYCVRATALDALGAGLSVVLLADAVRAIDSHPRDGAQALAEMEHRGARLSSTEALPS